MTEEHKCADCEFRKKAEAAPRSLTGILWKLHTYICPGWKSYQKSLDEEIGVVVSSEPPSRLNTR